MATFPPHLGPLPAGATRLSAPRCLWLILLAVGVLTRPAGATDHRVKVEATSHALPAEAHVTSYWIHSSNPAIAETGLRFWETSRHLKTALSAHGLFEAHDEASADLIVAIDFGIRPGPPRFEKTLLPVYTSDPTFLFPNPADPTNAAFRTRMAGRPGDFTQLIGYEEIKIPAESHEKYLYFAATENKPAVEGRPPATIWRIAASIEDERTDLRADLPVLAAVVMQSIGHETNGPALVRIADKNPAVAFIKKGP
jgi:hypothetical protein